MKFGVIGTGWIADEFVKGANTVNGFEFAAVYSRTKEKGEAFAKGSNAAVYTDMNEFMKSGIEAVYIASPNSLHYSQSRLMLENGLHVLCEKPITVTPDEFEELCALAKKKNLVYTEAIMYLHLPERQVLKEAVNSIGKIMTAHFDFSQLSSKYPAFLRNENPNIFNPEFRTGCLMDLGIYCIYPAVDLFGVPESITAQSGFLPTGADAYGTAVFTYSDKQVTLTYSKVGQSYLGSQIFGDEGTVKIPSVSQLTEMSVCAKEKQEKFISPDREKYVLMAFEAQDFYDYITDESTRTHLDECNEMIFKVSKIMKEIRDKANIGF